MTVEDEFWAWFMLNQAGLWNLPLGDYSHGAELRRQLDRVDQRLMWEIGVIDETTRDFVISADGVIEVAPIVHRLADAAPSIEGWKITRFRPRREPDSMRREGFELNASDVYLGFTSDPSDGPPYDIAVSLPGLTEQSFNGLGSVAMVMLDGWLGEEFVMTRLRNYTWQPQRQPRNPNLFSLTDAPRAFGLT